MCRGLRLSPLMPWRNRGSVSHTALSVSTWASTGGGCPQVSVGAMLSEDTSGYLSGSEPQTLPVHPEPRVSTFEDCAMIQLCICIYIHEQRNIYECMSICTCVRICICICIFVYAKKILKRIHPTQRLPLGRKFEEKKGLLIFTFYTSVSLKIL